MAAEAGKSGGEEDAFVLQEVAPADLTGWLDAHPGAVLLDVREPFELRLARFDHPRMVNAPMSDLARRGPEALPEAVAADADAQVLVMCHHGVRSVQVAAWMLESGWRQVYNLTGGIDAYARLVDPSVGLY